MALTVIAVVLVIVFFPILFGVASTALVVAVALGMYVIGIGIICYAFFCAGKAATNPTLAKRAAIIALLIHLIAPPLWNALHLNPNYLYMARPILLSYGASMMLIARARTFRSGKIMLGLLLVLAAPLLNVLPIPFGGLYFQTALRVLFYGLHLLGLVLLLQQPAHPDVPQQEKTGTLLVTGSIALSTLFAVFSTIWALAHYTPQSADGGITFPVAGVLFSYILKGLEIAGLVLFALSVFNEKRNRAQRG